jgi:hypothetical protein
MTALILSSSSISSCPINPICEQVKQQHATTEKVSSPSSGDPGGGHSILDDGTKTETGAQMNGKMKSSRRTY